MTSSSTVELISPAQDAAVASILSSGSSQFVIRPTAAGSITVRGTFDVRVFVHGKCAVLGMMVGCGASALESVDGARGRRPREAKGGRVTHGGCHGGSSPLFFSQQFLTVRDGAIEIGLLARVALGSAVLGATLAPRPSSGRPVPALVPVPAPVPVFWARRAAACSRLWSEPEREQRDHQRDAQE